MKTLIQSLKVYVIFSIILGIIYPLAVTFFAQVTIPEKANGSLILKDGRIIGSHFIGQNFTSPEYFQSRPSAVDYNAQGSGASNLGPSSKMLMDEVTKKIEQIRHENALSANSAIPADMALSSASGLDPHISIENAMLQVKRISKVRNIPEEELKNLVNKNTDPDFIGIWGMPGVNVLELNLALDENSMSAKNAESH